MRRGIRFLPFLSVACLVLLAGVAGAQVVRVDASAPGPARDGLSWQTAFLTVQEGVDRAQAGDEVWVARGIYSGNVRMKAGVALYGGFTGTMTALGERNWVLYTTVLDGMGAGSVVTINGANGVRVDGFTIRNGAGSIHTRGFVAGGGIFALGCSPAVANNTFSGNRAAWGGAVYLEGGGGSIDNNAFTGNAAENNGGGIMLFSANPAISGNRFAGNRAGTGGAIHAYWYSSPSIRGNVLEWNEASAHGGAIYAYNNSAPRIERNRIAGNGAAWGGGLYLCGTSSFVQGNFVTGNRASENGGGIACLNDSSGIASNVISRNEAANGGGIYLNNTANIAAVQPVAAGNTLLENRASAGGGIHLVTSSARVANNIVARNSDGIAQGPSGYGVPVLARNDVHGNGTDYVGISPGPTDFSADPKFIASVVVQVVDNTLPAEHRLTSASPCVDAGDNGMVPPGDALDVDGDARVRGVAVDVGADEHDDVPPETAIRLSGTPGENGYYVSDVTVELLASDYPQPGGATGVDNTEYSLDGIRWSRFSSRFLLSSSAAVDYRSTDRAGNVEPANPAAVVRIDKAPPSKSSTDPIAGATNVPRTKVVLVTWSEGVVAGPGWSGIKLTYVNSKRQTVQVPATVSLRAGDPGVLEIRPDAALLARTKYTATVPSGAVKDVAGNLSAAVPPFSFTTAR